MKRIIFLVLTCFLLQSCASILGGTKTDCQEKQRKGEVKKEIQVGYLIADIALVCPVCVIVDFVTGEIYRKEAKECSK